MATKQEHDQALRKYEQEHLLRAAQDARSVLFDNMRWMAAEALAERDFCQEKAKACEDALAEEIDTLRRERDEAREELAKLKAAQPESAPAAPPPSPGASEGSGPFYAVGERTIQRGEELMGVYYGSRDEFLRLLNLGLEAEKLRARVADLEKANARLYGLAEITEDAASTAESEVAKEKARADAAEKRVAELEGLWGSLRQTCDRWKSRYKDAEKRLEGMEDAASAAEGEVAKEKARADAADAKLAAHDKALDNAWTELESVHPVGIIGCDDIDKAAKVVCDELRRQDAAVKELREKLSALGENPIPRALVERHKAKLGVGGIAWETCDAILAGREPGATQ